MVAALRWPAEQGSPSVEPAGTEADGWWRNLETAAGDGGVSPIPALGSAPFRDGFATATVGHTANDRGGPWR